MSLQVISPIDPVRFGIGFVRFRVKFDSLILYSPLKARLKLLILIFSCVEANQIGEK